LKKLEIFLVGGQPGVAAQAQKIIVDKYPALKICGVSSGYFDDPFAVIKCIEKSPAKVVLCGMGSPRQENFLLELRKSGWSGIGFTCGGYLDQVGQGFAYYPDIIDRLNLRFLYRLVREPERLWRRYLLEYMTFVRLLCNKIIRFF
jgi:N-acetylglucosaminyldiphosphoundecaprenol N-acetyl-beta-D-mannosaminyltransferase